MKGHRLREELERSEDQAWLQVLAFAVKKKLVHEFAHDVDPDLEIEYFEKHFRNGPMSMFLGMSEEARSILLSYPFTANDEASVGQST
jgi:hypothetical protein